MVLSRRTLVFRYSLFAVISTIANLLSQRLVLLGGKDATWFILALGFGTLVGLVVKFVLDKRWIFFDQTQGVSENSKKFSVYTLMGVVTTIIFWGFEATFWMIWKTDLLREVGAIIGLSIGYFIKYHLDKKFVFTNIAPRNAA